MIPLYFNMPIYEYICTKKKRFEVTQRMSDDKLTQCPYHKNCKVRRILSSPTIFSDDIGRGFKRMKDRELYKDLDID